MGRRFTIYTDQQSLKNLTNQVIQTPEQQKWLGKLLGYEFSIVYRPRKQNQAADALSRSPDGVFLALSTHQLDWLTELRSANDSHPELTAIKDNITIGLEENDDFVVRDGLLFFRGRLVIPSDSPLKQHLLYEFHDSKIGGHAGVTCTFHRVSSNFLGQKCGKTSRLMWLPAKSINK